MKILIPGGTGQVGTVLARAFHGGGHEVECSAAGRKTRMADGKWDGKTLGPWTSEIDGSDVLSTSPAEA